MDEICIDASIAVRWIVPNQRWQHKARLLLNDAVDANIQFIAPPLFEYETESVVQKYLIQALCFRHKPMPRLLAWPPSILRLSLILT